MVLGPSWSGREVWAWLPPGAEGGKWALPLFEWQEKHRLAHLLEREESG